MGIYDRYTTLYPEIPQYFKAILEAKPPQIFSIEFLASLGFSNFDDRLIIGVLRNLGFLNSFGFPQQRYLDFLDPKQSSRVLVDGICEAYSDLFKVSKNANELTTKEISITLHTLYPDKETNLVIDQIAETFVALCQYANFSQANTKQEEVVTIEQNSEPKITDSNNYPSEQIKIDGSANLKPDEKFSTTAYPAQPNTISNVDLDEAANSAQAQPATIAKESMDASVYPMNSTVGLPFIPIFPTPSPGAGPGEAPSDPLTTINLGASDAPIMSPVLSLMDRDYVLEPFAITLSGGGAYGAFEVGALDFIYNYFLGSEEGVAAGFSRLRPDIVTGTSIGAVNGAWIAQGGNSMSELKDLWFGLKRNDDMFLLNSAFHDLLGNPGQLYGPAIGKVVADFGWGLLATGLVPFGFLLFGQVGADISDLYTLLNQQSSVYNLQPITDKFKDRESYWSPTGPGLRGAGVSVARDFPGHHIVFARGYDDMLYVRFQRDLNPISTTTSWSGWWSLGGPISSDPVAYYTGFLDGYGAADAAPINHQLRVGVMALLADGQYGGCILKFDDITHHDPTTSFDPFQPWTNVPPPPGPIRSFSSQPSIVQREPGGRAWAFCHDGGQGSTSFFSRAQWDDQDQSWGWEPWTQFGQTQFFQEGTDWNIAGNIIGCSYLDGTLVLFSHPTFGHPMYNFTADGSLPRDWRGGLPSPGYVPGDHGGWATTTSDFLVLSSEDSGSGYIQLDIFWRGNDGQVWTRRKVGSPAAWSIPHNLGGLITSNLCSGRNSNGACTIFARGLDDHLYELRQASRFADWPADAWNLVGAPPYLTLLGDPYTLTATPTSVSPTDGIEIYAVSSDHSVWMIRQQSDGRYSEWISLGGKIWTGIQLRMSTVALETGEDRFVDEAGRFAGTLERIISGDYGNIESSRTSGIIASASLPGLFPPVRLNGRTWVDGGVRRGVPIGAAIDLGAKRVIAISTAPTTLTPVGRMLPRTLSGSPDDGAGVLIENYSEAGIIDIAMRSLMRLVDNMHWAEITPETKWQVPVSVIQPTFKIKGGDAIDPGLIRINYAYGWMRAFDMLMAVPEQREAAIASTDRIINARCAAWAAEAIFREQYLIATMGDYNPNAEASIPGELRMAVEAAHFAQLALGHCRASKWELRDALVARGNAGFLFDPELPNWLATWEMYTPDERWGSAGDRLFHLPLTPFDEITIIVAINRTVGGSVGAASAPTLGG